MYPFVVKATYYDEDGEQKELHCLLYSTNIAEIAKRMITYCDPEDLEIHLVGDETQLFEVSEEIATALRLGNGCYADGIKILKETEETKNELDA